GIGTDGAIDRDRVVAQDAQRVHPAPVDAAIRSSTACAWPGTFTLRHSASRTPPGPIRNVLRMTPTWRLPYSIFSPITSNARHHDSSSSATSGNGAASLSRKRAWEATESRDTPMIAQFLRRNFGYRSRKSCASRVHPGVLSFG